MYLDRIGRLWGRLADHLRRDSSGCGLRVLRCILFPSLNTAGSLWNCGLPWSLRSALHDPPKTAGKELVPDVFLPLEVIVLLEQNPLHLVARRRLGVVADFLFTLAKQRAHNLLTLDLNRRAHARVRGDTMDDMEDER
jgi:hypothetical protein